MNIQGLEDIDDPFYRYKMEIPEYVLVKKTLIISKINSICKSLNRDPNDLVKYISAKLACKIKYNNNGSIEIKKNQIIDIIPIIREFTEKLVLCKTCKNPETNLLKNEFKLDCLACGNFSNIDINDKILSKILN